MRSIIRSAQSHLNRPLKGNSIPLVAPIRVVETSFSTTSDDNRKGPTTSDKTQDSRGAMRDYLKQQTGGGFFADLRQNLAPQNTYDNSRKPFNKGGSERPAGQRGPPRQGQNYRNAQNSNRRKFPSKSGPSQGSGYQGGRRFGKDGKDGGNRDRRDGNSTTDPMTILLNDIDDIEQMVRKKGLNLSTERLSPADILLGYSLIEGLKTNDAIFEDYYPAVDSNQRNLSQRKINAIPSARSVAQLQHSLLPKGLLNSVEAQQGMNLEFQEVALNAWNVVNRNYFYTPEQKVSVGNGIVRMLMELDQFVKVTEEQLEATKKEDRVLDRVLSGKFKPGRLFMEQEQREEMLQAAGTKKVVVDAKGETDWSVEAVEDEDAL